MDIDDIQSGLSDRGDYSAEIEDGVLRIVQLENGSEFILEMFEHNAQIRQAVWFDCHELPEAEQGQIHLLCAMMSQRFSGTKSFVDQWGTLITAADLLEQVLSIAFVETELGQIDFVSRAMLSLMETMEKQQRPVTEAEMDAALNFPTLQ